MSKDKKALEKLVTHPISQKIFATIPPQSTEIRLVGGAVRNAIGGWECCTYQGVDDIDDGPFTQISEPDLDFATSLPIEEFAKRAEENNLSVYPTGLAHGTVTVSDGNASAEVTQLRSDIDTDGRHASVKFHADWGQDAARRDFTINAIYLDQNGDVFDPQGGGKDIADARLQFIGKPSERLAEDYLRLLRALRLCAEYPQLALDEAALPAMRHASQYLNQLSYERIMAEIKRMFRGRGFTHILPYIGVLAIDKLVLNCQLARWTSLDNPQKEALLEAFHLSNFPTQLCVLASQPEQLVAHISTLKLSRVEQKAISQSCHIALGQHQHVEHIDKLASASWMQAGYWLGELAVFAYLHGAIEGRFAFDAARMRQIVRQKLPVCPVTGQDIISIYKVRGEEVGHRLKDVTAKWVESDFSLSKPELLSIMTQHASASR